MFISRYGLLAGTDYKEVVHAARREYRTIQQRNPRRQPYIRSQYFKGDKIFVNIFWNHLAQKRKGEQLQRAKLLTAAIDLIRTTAESPKTITGRNTPHELLYRFVGQTKDNVVFYVQVKENTKSKRKDFMSAFPARKPGTKNKKAFRWVA